MTLLNNVMTNTIHFSDSEFIQFQLRGDTSGTGVNFMFNWIYMLFTVQYSKTRTEIICSVHSTMYKEDSLPVLTAKLISSWRWHVQSMVLPVGH